MLYDRLRMVSIHAPREGSDQMAQLYLMAGVMFQSTLPAKGATSILHDSGIYCISFNPCSPRRERPALVVALVAVVYVSIHAPREGSDDSYAPPFSYLYCFNPRSPRRERPAHGLVLQRRILVSIHAPREGSDCYRFNFKHYA